MATKHVQVNHFEWKKTFYYTQKGLGKISDQKFCKLAVSKIKHFVFKIIQSPQKNILN